MLLFGHRNIEPVSFGYLSFVLAPLTHSKQEWLGLHVREYDELSLDNLREKGVREHEGAYTTGNDHIGSSRINSEGAPTLVGQPATAF